MKKIISKNKKNNFIFLIFFLTITSYLLACARYPPGGGGVWREFSNFFGKFGNLLNPGADARFQKSGGEAARNQRALAGFRGEAPEKIF